MKLFGKKSDKEEKKGQGADVARSSDPVKKAEPKKTVKETTAKKEEKKSSTKKKKAPKNAAAAYGVILAPLVSEKSHAQTDLHVYSFRVHKKATKTEVKKAIEALYEVNVERVNMVNMPVRRRTIGRNRGYQSGYRKALVKIDASDKIDFFEGV